MSFMYEVKREWSEVINKVGVDSDICVRASPPSPRGIESLKYANNGTPWTLGGGGHAVWLALNCLFLKYMFLVFTS